ncbi:MAG: hypothetical protein H0W76_09030 [Pyrinomonadaceae bacterium]|nr:hypothetical protein [Pyrinomonadaceae bacterium]MDQ3652956.1 hypothetical protein [Acidobacteriota bacterium]
MDETFEAIGLEVPSEKDFNHLAERAGDQGEATQLLRRGAVLHGRCWKLGEGLEVWTVLYESGTGDVFYADCRPGFRARYAQRISPWALTEYDEDGEAIVHGYCDGTEIEVLFELQNLTEVGPEGFRAQELHVGLCGLAYRARVCAKEERVRWQPLEEAAPSRAAHENDWSLCGRVISFKPLRNPLSGSELYWVYLDLDSHKLEVLINRRALRGAKLVAGATLAAEVWLQGHVLDQRAMLSRYEGTDRSHSLADLWSGLKRRN